MGCFLDSSRSSEFDDTKFDFPTGNLVQARFTKKMSFLPGISLKQVNFRSSEQFFIEKKIFFFPQR